MGERSDDEQAKRERSGLFVCLFVCLLGCSLFVRLFVCPTAACGESGRNTAHRPDHSSCTVFTLLVHIIL